MLAKMVDHWILIQEVQQNQYLQTIKYLRAKKMYIISKGTLLPK